MREAAEFLLSFMVTDKNGHLATAPSNSPENAYKMSDGKVFNLTYSATMDIEISLELFNACLKAGAILGEDKAFMDSLRKAIASLPPIKIGERYNLPMVSIKGIYSFLDNEFPKKKFFSDEYHPNSTGHGMMADALMRTIQDAAAAETAAADIDLDVKPAFGTDFMDLKTIYGDTKTDEFTVERGSFDKKDLKAYRNTPVGVVCGENNFCHGKSSEGLEPLKVTGVFSKCVISWLASADDAYGTAEVYVDGKLKTTLRGGAGKWGQSEAVLVFDAKESAEHTVEIRVTEEGKKFTITAISVK